MSTPTYEQLVDLANEKSQHLVSLYASMQRAGTEVRQNQFRWKNVLKEAYKKLAESGIAKSVTTRLLRPAEERVNDESFWQNQSDGLAFFLSGTGAVTFQLPVPFDQRVVVGDSFYLRPLFPAVRNDEKLRVFAANDWGIRLSTRPRSEILQPVVDAGAKLNRSEKVVAIGDESRTRNSSNDVIEILNAARSGYLHTLWIADDFGCFGQREDSGNVAFVSDHESRLMNFDIVNQILIETFRHEGIIISVVSGLLPAGFGIFATFRSKIEATAGNLRKAFGSRKRLF